MNMITTVFCLCFVYVLLKQSILPAGGTNVPPSVKEIARCVFSKDDDTQIRLKLVDENEKPYYVKMDNSE